MKKIFSYILLALAASGIPAFAAEPANYYASCEGKSGAALLSALRAVVGPHTTVSYDGLWSVYLDSDVDENGKIWDMYSTKRWSTTSGKCGNYSAVGDCYNREHSFPKSWFNEASPMKSDAFHVYPTDGKVNGQRSNYPYGECANGTTLPSRNGVQALGKLGTSTFPGYSGKVFEPVDEYKGDFARTYFYMAAAYNDKISNWDSDMLAGNSYPAYTTWAVNLLLKWHRQDEVSKKETDRNDAVYGHQKNRNPFIDHPELAEYIWGNKVGTPWYANGDPDPTWALPVDNSTIDFGLSATNYTISRAIDVKGSNLTSNVSISLSGSDFTLQQSSVTAAAANAGTFISVSFKRATAGVSTGTLTFTSGDLSSSVNLRAEALDGIPALDATNITETGFTARWKSLGDAETYQLSVRQNGTLLPGYPVSVNAEAEEYDVTGLLPATLYTYTLSDGTKTSNEISVATATPIPDVQYLNGPSFNFLLDPGTASDAVEVWIDVENISSALSVSVNAPFALSTDMTNWSQSISMEPQEDRFYLRVNATDMGEYESSIIIANGDYVNDEGYASASVRDTSTPWFIEDFEKAENPENPDISYGSYDNKVFYGTPCDWNLTDAGLWSSDKANNGTYALRLGKTDKSAIESATPKDSGIGTISFYAKPWRDDGDLTLQVEYLPAEASDWTSAAEVVVNADSYTLYTVTVKAPGSNYIRLRQTAGKRGFIDDITVTDYADNSTNIIELDSLGNWDAFCLNKALVIINHGSESASFHVYDLDGRTVAATKLHGSLTASKVADSQYSISLPAGLYIITDGSNSRRVLIK